MSLIRRIHQAKGASPRAFKPKTVKRRMKGATRQKSLHRAMFKFAEGVKSRC